MKNFIHKAVLSLSMLAITAMPAFAGKSGYGHTPEETSIAFENNAMIAISFFVFLVGVMFIFTSKSLLAKLKS